MTNMVAMGCIIDGEVTTVYAPELKHRVNYRNHATALWSELVPLIAMVEAADVPGTAERVASAKEACQAFYDFWQEEIERL